MSVSFNTTQHLTLKLLYSDVDCFENMTQFHLPFLQWAKCTKCPNNNFRITTDVNGRSDEIIAARLTVRFTGGRITTPVSVALTTALWLTNQHVARVAAVVDDAIEASLDRDYTKTAVHHRTEIVTFLLCTQQAGTRSGASCDTWLSQIVTEKYH